MDIQVSELRKIVRPAVKVLMTRGEMKKKHLITSENVWKNRYRWRKETNLASYETIEFYGVYVAGRELSDILNLYKPDDIVSVTLIDDTIKIIHSDKRTKNVTTLKVKGKSDVFTRLY